MQRTEKRVQRVELQRVDPDRARLLRRDWHYPRQRPISTPHVEHLAAEMRDGDFNTVMIHCVLVGDATWIVNGNHTLEAIILSGVPQMLCFLYTACGSEAEAALIYSNHDLHRRRSWIDSFRATGIYDRLDVGATMTSAFSKALQLIMVGLDAPTGTLSLDPKILHSRDLRMDALIEYQPYELAYAAAIADGERMMRDRLTSAPVAAVGMEIIRYQGARGEDFIRRVAANDGLVVGDPARALVQWLLANTRKAGKKMSDRLRINAVTLAWNAYHRGEALELLRPASLSRYVLEGTPWRNGNRPKLDCQLAAEARRPRGDDDAALPAIAGPKPRPPLPGLVKTGVRVGADGEQHAVAFVDPR